MDVIKKGVGEQLKLLRSIKNLTQEALAERIGINLRQLARIEAGESFISSDTLLKICVALEISPKSLFDFEIQQKIIKTGSGKNLHFNVIKEGTLLKLDFKGQNEEDLFDKKMLVLAQRMRKEILVDIIQDKELIASKVYSPDGDIKITQIQEEKTNYELLKNNLEKISSDEKKIEFMNLAYDSLTNQESLEKLKILIKGIELLR